MSKKTLVFGASLKEDRYSNRAVRLLLSNGHEVLAYGFQDGQIETVNLDTKMLRYENIDTISMYLSPKRQKAYYKYIIGLNPRRIIFNPGTENPEFYNHLRDTEIDFEEACTLVLLSINQY
jgi:predicted CoA-binding protein